MIMQKNTQEERSSASQKKDLGDNKVFQSDITEEERMEYLGRKILKEHLDAFKELAK